MNIRWSKQLALDREIPDDAAVPAPTDASLLSTPQETGPQSPESQDMAEDDDDII